MAITLIMLFVLIPASTINVSAASIGTDPASVIAETGEAPGGTPFTVKKDLGYVDNAHFQQMLDVFIPDGPVPEGGWPVIVNIPGGGYNTCSKDLFDYTSQPFFRHRNPYQLGALDNDFAMIVVAYRTPVDVTGREPNGGMDSSIPSAERPYLMADDVMDALRYITANAAALGINADQLLIIADSAGGGIASYITYDQDYVGFSIKAMAGYAPAISNFAPGGDLTRLASKAGPDSPPYLLTTGSHDSVCPPETRGLDFTNILLSKGVHATLDILPDASHMNVDRPDNYYARSMDLGRGNDVWDWFKLVLAGNLPAPAPTSYRLTYDASTKGAVDVVGEPILALEPLVAENYDYSVSAEAVKLKGNQNELTISVTATYYNGSTSVITEKFLIDNNAVGTYKVGAHKVFVDTKGNTQIRDCRLVW